MGHLLITVVIFFSRFGPLLKKLFGVERSSLFGLFANDEVKVLNDVDLVGVVGEHGLDVQALHPVSQCSAGRL